MLDINAIAILHFQFIVAHALRFSVSIVVSWQRISTQKLALRIIAISCSINLETRNSTKTPCTPHSSSLLLRLRNSADLCRRSTDTVYRKHMSRDGYPASPLAHWLLPAENMSRDSYPLLWWRHFTCASCTGRKKVRLLYCWPCVCCGRCLAIDIHVTLLIVYP
jgi:hypothetical protein